MDRFEFKISNSENILNFQGFDFKYIFKKCRYDTQHLIVVFSGYGGKSQFTYDFKSSLGTNRANVLWIKDDFFNNEHTTYYLDPIRKGLSNERQLETAIHAFIEKILDELNLCKDQCTLLGCSKGASVALYYGTKYHFKNLILSAPAFLIGSRITGRIPKMAPKENAKFMLEDVNNLEHIQRLDRYILDALRDDTNLIKNIYLIVSKVDYLYEQQIQPFLYELVKYHNFNYIESISPLVRTHQDVTFHNAPLILSILGSLSFNMPPTYAKSIIGEQLYSKEISYIDKQVVFDLEKIFFDQGRLYLAGVYFLRGLECKEYGDLEYTLLLKSENKVYTEVLAKGDRKVITKDYYQDRFFNYDKAYFCTTGYKGLSLPDMDIDEYQLSISIKMKTGEIDTVRLPEIDIKQSSLVIHDKKYSLVTRDAYLFLKVESL